MMKHDEKQCFASGCKDTGGQEDLPRFHHLGHPIEHLCCGGLRRLVDELQEDVVLKLSHKQAHSYIR